MLFRLVQLLFPPSFFVSNTLLLYQLGIRQRVVPLILEFSPRLFERRNQVLVVRLGVFERLVGTIQVGIVSLLACPKFFNAFFQLKDTSTKLHSISADLAD